MEQALGKQKPIEKKNKPDNVIIKVTLRNFRIVVVGVEEQ